MLAPYLPDYRPFHPQFNFLFNSYYQTVGQCWPRPQRGLLSRPTVAEVFRYRAYVDEQMDRLLRTEVSSLDLEIAERTVLGLHHEQQHQELLVTDLKHAWAANPLHPVYRPIIEELGETAASAWHSCPGGLTWIGHDGPDFVFDNETPRHRVFLNVFQMASRLTTNAEYLAFVSDGGYGRPELWLSDGWAARLTQGWTAPLYWEKQDEEWNVITLAGPRSLAPDEPVCHVSYYEADAFGRWSGARLPTEAEWETVAARAPLTGHYQESGHFQPAAAPAAADAGSLYQLYGDVWQWTASPYVGYPGYRPLDGALGEYNGKFMCNQFVLRGVSCATPRSHARRTYRDFFPPDARWQFSGIRLARDLS